MKSKLSRLFGKLKNKSGDENAVGASKDKPIELTGVTEANRPIIVYVGNGAASSDYEEYFKVHDLEGRTYEGIGGIHNLCALCYADKDGAAKKVHAGFQHPSEEARFSGFVLRKKENGEWLWYTETGNWEKLSSDMTPFCYFQEGDTLPEFSGNEVFLLAAKWEDADGHAMNCGWRMFQNDLMAHALGGLNKKVYLNTLAAFENSQKLGYRYFETDFTLTSDERLVVIHGWTETDLKRLGIPYDPAYENMTYDMVRGLKIHGEPVMDVREFYEVVKKADPDYTFEVDTHVAPAEHTQKIIREFLNDFQQDHEQLKKMLIQVYNEKMYYAVDNAYHFEVYQYNIHNSTAKLDQIIQFCLDNGICAVAFRAGEARPEYIRKLKNAGLYILAYTIDSDLTYAKTMLKYGADTICTNFITQEMLDSHTETFDTYPYKLVFNSDSQDAVSDFEEPVQTLKSGVLEVVISQAWVNDGKTPLPKNQFRQAGKAFAGWKLRRRLDGSHYWLCEDGLWRLSTKFKEGTQKVPHVFADGDVLPVMDVSKDTAIVLAAQWKEDSEKQ